jgi:hypothetical protein
MSIIIIIFIYLLNISTLPTIALIVITFIDSTMEGKEKFVMIWSLSIYVIAYVMLFISVWKEKRETQENYTWGTFGTLLFIPLIVLIVQIMIIAPALYWVYGIVM